MGKMVDVYVGEDGHDLHMSELPENLKGSYTPRCDCHRCRQVPEEVLEAYRRHCIEAGRWQSAMSELFDTGNLPTDVMELVHPVITTTPRL